MAQKRGLRRFCHVDPGIMFARLAAAPDGARRLDRLAGLKKANDRDHSSTCRALIKALLPLADFVDASCGRLSPLAADAIRTIIHSRHDRLSRTAFGKYPTAKPVPPEGRGRLFIGLEKVTRRLLPRLVRIDRREKEIADELRSMVPKRDWRPIREYRRAPHRAPYSMWSVLGARRRWDVMEEPWLHLLSTRVDDWRRWADEHREYMRGPR